MKVFVLDEQNDLSIALHSVEPIVKQVLELEKRSTDEVEIHFVSTAEISRLHQEYFGDPETTDCISFPIDEDQKTDYHVLGALFVCPKTAINRVNKKKNPKKEEYYLETTLYLVHSLLHLIGYDDIHEKDRKKMKEAEKRHMKHLVKTKSLLFGIWGMLQKRI